MVTVKENFEILSIAESVKFFTSICLGISAILSVFAFLFLIPFIVDPAISSILADYEQEPVTCVTTRHVYAEGLKNCTWTSCREGCTKEATRCHQIYVNYSKTPFIKHFTEDTTPPSWDMINTRFMINTDGCGYPPSINCSLFVKQYNTIGTVFPCYYSRVYSNMAVARYSWDDNLKQLVLSITIPNLVFAISVGILSYWYCPGCGKSCNAYVRHFPTK